MTRIGKPRVRHVVPGRILALAAVGMLLLTLAASVLVSAGSPHHARSATAGVTVVHLGTDSVSPAADHDHKHGNDWVPTLGERLRPAGTAAMVGTVPARLDEPGAAHDTATSPALEAPDDRLVSLSVLRV